MRAFKGDEQKLGLLELLGCFRWKQLMRSERRRHVFYCRLRISHTDWHHEIKQLNQRNKGAVWSATRDEKATSGNIYCITIAWVTTGAKSTLPGCFPLLSECNASWWWRWAWWWDHPGSVEHSCWGLPYLRKQTHTSWMNLLGKLKPLIGFTILCRIKIKKTKQRVTIACWSVSYILSHQHQTPLPSSPKHM